MVRQLDVPGRCSSSSKSCDEFGLPPPHAQAAKPCSRHNIRSCFTVWLLLQVEKSEHTLRLRHLQCCISGGFREEAHGGTVYGGENSPR
jgi:hypothetical protein